MRYKLYISSLILAFLLCFQAFTSFGQVIITVPSTSDTVLCNGGPLTLHSVNNGRIPTNVNFGVSAPDDYYSTTTIPIGFSFDFYGNTYTNCVISSNGYISFNTSNAGQPSQWQLNAGELGIPGNTATLNSLLGVYADIYLNANNGGGSIDYATIGTAPNREFIVTFCNVPMYSCTTQHIIFQMILYETSNLLDVYIKNKVICSQWNGGQAIEGVQNAAGTVATVVPGRNNTAWTANHDGQRFIPNATISGYADSSVPYIHVATASAPMLWFQGFPITGPLLATGDTLTVNPDTPTTYTVLAVDCGDTSFAHVTVVVGTKPVISGLAATSPTFCDSMNGTISLFGLLPNNTYTVFYNWQGVSQPSIVATADGNGIVTVPGLGQGFYDNIVVVTGSSTSTGPCPSDPVGPITLVTPPFIITNITADSPTVCGANDGKITLYGIFPGHSDTINYTRNGVSQPPVFTTAAPDSTVAITGLDTGTYDNITVKVDTCISNPAGPVHLGEPTFILSGITYVYPSCHGSCDGSMTLHGLTPVQSITVNYNLNGNPQPAVTQTSLPDSTVTITGLCEGTIDNVIATLNTCNTMAPPDSTLFTPPLSPSYTYVVHPGCNGDTVVFTNTTYTLAAGPFFYRWDFGDNSTDSTAAGVTHVYHTQDTFYATLFMTNHICSDSVTDTIPLIHPIDASFTSVGADTLCQGGAIAFTNTSIGGSPNFMWNFGDGGTDNTPSPTHTFNNTGIDTVVLTETDFLGCIDTATLVVHVDSASSIGLTLSNGSVCIGKAVTLAGDYSNVGLVGITWSFGDSSSESNVNPVSHAYDAVGTYTITATVDYRVCPQATATTTATVLPTPMINLGRDTAMCPNSQPIVITDMLNAGNPSATWLWNTGDTTSSITVSQPGLYYTTVTIGGCTNADSVDVLNDCYVSVPNAFTPNGDGINDYFFPRQLLSEGVVGFSMNIYNRWGQQIFTTTNTDGRGWDGKMNNQMQPEGVYVYIIDIEFKDGRKEHYQGNVSLLK